ncbi:peptidoglycan-binding protein LysM [Streptomyces longisporoflavus]|uniref:LysM peptidoglycan-binding domain-containing protein n=1 Tax=Streptomyces longisporoflavus TaxID=28044 RepID=UPI00167CB06D|nr:transglycosylase family protein [Streptomyces longisporoflavus]GGV52623.1 peptidoglycan-binding protein LysM [Streptomyces longisporoflavus]
MLSGNGRHRRPRQAPALIVAAGVAGSAIAIPLLGATSASAASTATWDKLAECESGGAWSADEGNGYYGGLQLSQEAWENYGGLDYAPSADQASRSQQISVAEAVLDDQGPKAWPSCAPIAGLTQDGAAADVDPGAPITTVPSDEASESSGSSDSPDAPDSPDSSDSAKSGGSKESDEPSTSPSESADPSDSTDSTDNAESSDKSRDKNHDESGKSGASDDSAKSGRDDATSSDPDPDPAPSADDGAGRHRGGSADDEASDGASREGSGRHASRGDERQENGSEGTYTVRSGDNLWAIADDLDVKGGWTELYAENEESVGSDPDLILPGQSLDLGEK